MTKGYWYLVERFDGKQIAVCRTRHDAVGVRGRCHAGKRSWYDIIPIRPVIDWGPRMTTDFD